MNKADVLVLGADFGTQGVRVAVFDGLGQLITMNFQTYPTFYPKPGWAEQHPDSWWEAFKEALANCLGQVKHQEKIRGMTLCSTSSTVLAADKAGVPLTEAILWMDNRATAEAEKINSSEHVYLKFSGGSDSVEWMLPKTLWLKNNRPDIYQQAHIIVEMQDWLNFKLTGQWVASRCNATCKWNYVDLQGEGGWSDKFMQEIGLGDYRWKIPTRVISVGQSVGKITDAVARELGLPPELQVFQGGIDAHIGMLGMGVVEPGQMSIIMGTSFVHLAHAPKPIFKKGLWGPYPHALIDNLWLLEGGQVSCGSLTRWFKDQMAKELAYTQAGKEPYQVLMEEADQVPPGSEGLVVLDTWQGNRTPYRDPLAKGCIWGLTLSHSRAHIYRALLESVAYGTKNILNCFSESDFRIEQIVACGGVLKNKLWLQIIADVTGLPIQKTKFSEAGVLGCAICSCAGLGIYRDLAEAAKTMVQYGERVEPNAENHLHYSYYFEKYRQTYELLAPQMHQLHKFQQNRGDSFE